MLNRAESTIILLLFRNLIFQRLGVHGGVVAGEFDGGAALPLLLRRHPAHAQKQVELS